MAKFRLLLDSKAGDHISNAIPPAEAAVAAMRIERIVGRPVELIPDTKRLRRELAAVDAVARHLASQPAPAGMFFPIAVAWNRPVPVDACSCGKCQAESFHPPAVAEEEHAEFAPPPLQHGMATIEEEDETPTAKMPCVPTIPRRRTLAEQRRDAWQLFGTSCRRWSWRWPLIIPPTFVLLTLASCLSLALVAFAWFVAKEHSL